MSIRIMFTLCFGLSVFSPCFASADVTLIDPAIRNGGFEDPTVAPWNGQFGATVTRGTTAGLAFSGAAYGEIRATADSTGLAEGVIAQTLTLNPADGRELDVSYWVRVPSSGEFQSIGIFSSGVVRPTSSNAPTLSSSEWRVYSAHMELRPEWAGEPILIGPAFISHGTAGNAFLGYVDDVRVIQSVPEPAACVLIIPMLLCARRRR